MSGPEKASREQQKKQILKLISDKVVLPPVSRMYVIGLMVTAGAVLLLPLLYFAVMASLFVALYFLILKAQFLATGLLVVLILGLIKPFFAKTSAAKRPYPLRREAEPFLFEYIDRLCDALGASRPTSIHLSCDMNAAAELRSGWLMGAGHKGIALHIGLPVVAGLTLRQFTGVLAHELGHFTQRTAMWLGNIVRRTIQWLLQVAYEQDAIDDWLSLQIKNGGPHAVFCYVACGVIWTTRWIWLGLAKAGMIISCMMSREMEYNADRCEARAVGAKTFATTQWRMRELSVAHQVSFRDVAMFFDEGRLPDNIIALATANISFVTPKVQQSLQQALAQSKTGLFDTHPSDRDRIQAVKDDGSKAVFGFGPSTSQIPASVLFDRFDEISRVVTTQFYKNLLNCTIKPQQLHPVDKLLEMQTARIEAVKSLKRYFQTDIPPLRPLPIPPQSTDVPENIEEAIQEIKSCRQRMLAALPNYKNLASRYETTEETFYEAVAAQVLVQVKLPFKPATYHISDANEAVVSDKLSRARESVAKLASKLLPFETEAGNRLSFAMQLMQVESIYEKIPRGEDLYYEVQQFLPEAQFVSRLISELPTLRLIFTRLVVLIEHIGRDQKNVEALERIVELSNKLRKRLISIQEQMGDHLYPFDHAKADTTLQEYALPQIPIEHDVVAMVNATEHLQSRLVMIQMRLFAQLAQTAEKVEHQIGLPPLPDPADQED